MKQTMRNAGVRAGWPGAVPAPWIPNNGGEDAAGPAGETPALRGYSLVEVLIAMALLGIVIVSVTALFLAGRKNVYSGKQMTQAVSLCTRVTETLQGMDKPALVAAFALPAGAGATVTAGGVSYPNSFIRTTTSISSGTDPSGYLQKWKDEITNNNLFNNGVVTLVITPTADAANDPDQMAGATVVRVRAIVTWKENLRSRQVELDSIKVYR